MPPTLSSLCEQMQQITIDSTHMAAACARAKPCAASSPCRQPTPASSRMATVAAMADEMAVLVGPTPRQGQHAPTCDSLRSPGRPCTCGYAARRDRRDELVARFRKIAPVPVSDPRD
jgi:hypothetical protein